MAVRLSRPLKTLVSSKTPSILRTMSSSAPKVREFLVILPDKPGVRQKRLEVRPTHFQNMKPHVESGNWKMGGALLNEVPADDTAANFDFFGSTVVCKGVSKEAVLEELKKDIYATSGVWDVDKIQIYPFICAFRNP
ncbi:Dimeric alpha-beta barrel [Metarhizium rileyi]|uniref:Dimeric alpha-beta barrel n=1 Tax=Metarhizium rileyi (strain RCEF 4871) TaxID=1649241 RepID=A0A167AWX5_METRR|nr:Dimeric alpha-beta barrel [Metarhizium rileyi RCEF 4871]